MGVSKKLLILLILVTLRSLNSVYFNKVIILVLFISPIVVNEYLLYLIEKKLL